MTKRRGRLTRREQIESVNRGLRAWGVMFGKPEVAERLVTPEPKRRTRKSDMRGVDIDAIHRKPLERDVLKAIVKVLMLDPRVALVERQTSGVFKEGNRYIRAGTRGALDLRVVLRGGLSGEIEVKRPGGKAEPHQLARIERLRSMGMFAGVATNPQEALEILPCPPRSI